jgi:hypothetical protein
MKQYDACAFSTPFLFCLDNSFWLNKGVSKEVSPGSSLISGSLQINCAMADDEPWWEDKIRGGCWEDQLFEKLQRYNQLKQLQGK